MPNYQGQPRRRDASINMHRAVAESAKAGQLLRSTNVSIARGYVEAIIDRKLDAALVAAARTLARAIDEEAAPGGDRYLLAKLIAEFRDTVIRLRLDPVSRGGDKNDFAGLLDSLRTPEVGNTPNP